MAWLTDATLGKMAELDAADMKYCTKLAGRLQKMGLSSRAASAALTSMIEEEAVPNGCATTPTFSLFKECIESSS